MDFPRYIISVCFFVPWLAYSQDIVLLTVHGQSNPKLVVTGYRLHLSIDEMNTVCDPYTGKLTPEDQIRIFTDSLRNYGIDLSKFICEGERLKYQQYYDDHMGAPHPNVVKGYVLEDVQFHQIRDIQAMAKMLYIDIDEIIPIKAFAAGVTKETIIKNALDDAEAQVALIADAMQMSVVQLVEIYESSDDLDLGYSTGIPFILYGSVSLKAALVSR